MRKEYALASLALAGLLLLASSPGRAQSTPAYLNTSVHATGLRWSPIGGYVGIRVNYTSGLPSTTIVFVYARVMSLSNQTAAVSVGTCALSPSQNTTCFDAFSSTFTTGIWRVTVFAATTGGVPISIENSTYFAV